MTAKKKSYVIDVSRVNPKNATRVEIYALMMHEYGSGDNDKPQPPALTAKLAYIDLIASPKNPLYGYDSYDNPAYLENFFHGRIKLGRACR